MNPQTPPPTIVAVPAKLRSKDIDVRIAVTRALLAAGVHRLSIRHEITLDTSSSDGRADMVLALDHCIAGIEIKSGKDTLDRLDLQHGRYATHFDRAMLVADVRHRDSNDPGEKVRRWNFCQFHNSDPASAECFEGRFGNVGYWGDRGDFRDLVRVKSAENGSRRTSPQAMLELLWAAEAERAAFQLGGVGRGTRCRTIPMLADAHSLAAIRKVVAGLLRERPLNKWEESFWRIYDAQPAEAVAA